MLNRHATWFLVVLILALAPRAGARDAGEPIKLAYDEGELTGFVSIFGKDGTEPIGVVHYNQRRKGDTLEAKRVAYFNDGSSDEDSAVAKVGKTLRTVRGESIIRNSAGETIVDMHIDVGQGRVWGFYGQGKEKTDFDERGELPAGNLLRTADQPGAEEFRRQRDGRQARLPYRRADAQPAQDRHGSVA